MCVESEGGQHEETGRVRSGETQRALGVPKGMTDTPLLWGGEGSVPGVPREEDGRVHHQNVLQWSLLTQPVLADEYQDGNDAQRNHQSSPRGG